MREKRDREEQPHGMKIVLAHPSRSRWRQAQPAVRAITAMVGPSIFGQRTKRQADMLRPTN